MSWKLKTAPATEPVSLSEMKLHLKMDDISADDSLITSLITAARMNCERHCNMGFIKQYWTYTSDKLENMFYLNKYPVSDIVEIKYYSSAGNELTTLDPDLYDVDLQNAPARISKAWNATYPEIYTRINAVQIEIEIGYANAAAVPDDIKAAIKLLVAHLYENRESVVIGRMVNELPMGVKYLLSNYRSFVW